MSERVRSVKFIDRPSHGVFYYQLFSKDGERNRTAWHTCPGCEDNHEKGKQEHCGRCEDYLSKILRGEVEYL